ncbi:MAG: hypothetical protein SH819_14810 [Cytophagales bacterium]|nr:hypothetical protein [Cytophagales bacterium]
MIKLNLLGLLLWGCTAVAQSLTIPANSTYIFDKASNTFDQLIIEDGARIKFLVGAPVVVFKCSSVRIGEGVLISGTGATGQSGALPDRTESVSNCMRGPHGHLGQRGSNGDNGLIIRIETDQFAYKAFTVNVSGGNGGAGGRGGKGGDGGDSDCNCDGKNGGEGGPGGRGGNGGHPGMFQVFSTRVIGESALPPVTIMMAGGKAGWGGLGGAGGKGGRGKSCKGESKAGGTSGGSGDGGSNGGPGRSGIPGAWLFKQFTYATLSSAASNSCACIKSQKYKAPEKRVLNASILACVEQQAGQVAAKLPAGTENPVGTSEEALTKLMRIDCPTELDQWELEAENKRITIHESADFRQAYKEAACRCVGGGKNLLECIAAINELNAEKMKEHFQVSDPGKVQSDLALEATLSMGNECAGAASDPTVARISEFSPVSSDCQSFTTAQYLGGMGVGESSISFEGNTLIMEGEKRTEKFTVSWDGCTATLVSLTRSKTTQKGDQHQLKILRASDDGFMGVLETASSREMVFYKKRPTLTKTEMVYRGQKFFVGQHVLLSGTKDEEPVLHVQYFDPNSIAYLPIPEETKIEGTIKRVYYNRAINRFWLLVEPNGAFPYGKIFIDVEGGWDKGEFQVKDP